MQRREAVYITALATFVTLAATWRFWLTPGYIYLAEEFEVFTPDQFLGVAYPLWNEALGRFPFSDALKLYYYLFLYAIGKALGYKALQGVALSLPIYLSFISSYALARYLIGGRAAPLLAALAYTINPWVAVNPRNLILRLEYSLFPLLFLYLFKYIDTKRGKYIIYMALILGTIYSVRSWTLFILYSTVVILLHIFTKRDLKALAAYLAHPLALAIAAPRILPSAYYLIYSGQEYVSYYYAKPIAPLEFFTTYLYTYPGAAFELTYNDASYILYLALALTIPLLIFSKDLRLRAIFFVYLTAYVLAINPPSLGTLLDRLLRAGYWNAMIAPLATSIAAGYAASKKRGRGEFLTAVILGAFAVISAWPVVTGDMAGYWRPAPPPTDYLEAKTALKNAAGLTLWLPYIGDMRAIWSNQRGITDVAAPTGITEVRGVGAPAVEWRMWYLLTYLIPLNGTFALQPYETYRGDLARALGALGVKYIGIVYDRNWTLPFKAGGLTNERLREFGEILVASGEAEYVIKGPHMAVLKLNNNATTCRLAWPLFCLCSLTELGEILNATDNPPAVILPQPGLDIVYIVKNTLIYAPNKTELVLYAASQLPNSHVYPAASYAPNEQPDKGWTKAPMTEHAMFDFLDYLYSNGVKDWPWPNDYGLGFAYTTAGKPLAIPIKAEERAIVAVRILTTRQGGKATVLIDDTIRKNLTTQSNYTQLNWYIVGEVGPGQHLLEIRPEGLTAINLIAVIPTRNLEAAEALLAGAKYVEKTQLLQLPPAGGAQCRKVSPTKWEIKTWMENIGEVQPALVLALPYDPLWRADGQKPVAAYGTLTALLNPQARQVEYTPQEVFHMSFYIAGAAILGITLKYSPFLSVYENTQKNNLYSTSGVNSACGADICTSDTRRRQSRNHGNKPRRKASRLF